VPRPDRAADVPGKSSRHRTGAESGAASLGEAAPAPLGPPASLQDEVSRLKPVHFGHPPRARRHRRRSPGRDHGRWRRLHHGAGDDLPSGDAYEGRDRDLALPDHLRHRLHHLHARLDQPLGGPDARASPDPRRRCRGTGRHAVRRAAESGATAHPAGASGTRRRPEARRRPPDRAARTLFHFGSGAAMRGAALLLALLAVPAPVAAGEEVVAGLSRSAISITANFDGSDLIVYGAVKRDAPAPSDSRLEVIVTVEGPSTPITVRRKSRAFGIWVNTASVEVDRAPSVYAVATTGPLDQILSQTEDLRRKISVPQMIRSVGAPQDIADSPAFTEALIRVREANGLYSLHEGTVNLA